jgi:hypothetical protein
MDRPGTMRSVKRRTMSKINLYFKKLSSLNYLMTNTPCFDLCMFTPIPTLLGFAFRGSCERSDALVGGLITTESCGSLCKELII